MAWTAKLLRLSKAHGRFDLEIQYSDGSGKPINKSYSFERTSKAKIRALARREVARLQEVTDEVIDIVVDANIDLTPPPGPPAPTPAQIAREAWFVDLNKLRVLLTMVNLSLLPANDNRIAPLQASLVADFQNVYLRGIET